jgi:Rieske Fe-S protein
MSERDGCAGRCAMGRRALLQAGAAGLASLVLPACGGEEPPGPPAPDGAGVVSGSTLTIDLANAANAPLTTVDGAVFISVPGDLLIVVRLGQADVVALSAYCTHSSCLVGWDSGQDAVRCPCHGSRFDPRGGVLRGPALDPLRAYPAALAGETITVSLA